MQTDKNRWMHVGRGLGRYICSVRVVRSLFSIKKIECSWTEVKLGREKNTPGSVYYGIAALTLDIKKFRAGLLYLCTYTASVSTSSIIML